MEFSSDLWPRDWELCYRAGEILLHRVAARDGVVERRRSSLQRRPPPYNASEAARFSDDAAPVVDWLESRWLSLFDRWAAARERYVFQDGYALLFFLRVFWANQDVLLRGHADARWRVETSRARSLRQQGPEATAHARAAAAAFVAQAEQWPPLRRQYPRGLSEPHREAICQHYGFPTDYLDFTFSFDVALYFAECWLDLGRQPLPEQGAIFAVPVHAINQEAVLVTLPPAVMRPSLQIGKFVGVRGAGACATIEQHKFTYRHSSYPIASGLSQISPTTIPPLRDYLFPPSDPLESMAAKHRNAGRT